MGESSHVILKDKTNSLSVFLIMMVNVGDWKFFQRKELSSLVEMTINSMKLTSQINKWSELVPFTTRKKKGNMRQTRLNLLLQHYVNIHLTSKVELFATQSTMIILLSAITMEILPYIHTMILIENLLLSWLHKNGLKPCHILRMENILP